MLIEQVRSLDEFRMIVNPRYRIHYMIEFLSSLDPNGKMAVLFKLQGFSKVYYIDDEPAIHIVEYTTMFSVSWQDKAVIRLMEKNPGMRTTEAMTKVLEEKAKEFLKIAEEFNATEGQYILG
ncbi:MULTISPECIES: hypothetical protein [unclassified Archaeoglobus]|jgi:hypothetical protein|uniref:hypothetical protein n=1 Tax=unclassified Archaeoglobus TaxID=2643606 RepID=UPI0025B8C540|nr:MULTISPECIES: hypothetical protein [unclassified Archaeoglobus]